MPDFCRGGPGPFAVEVNDLDSMGSYWGICTCIREQLFEAEPMGAFLLAPAYAHGCPNDLRDAIWVSEILSGRAVVFVGLVYRFCNDLCRRILSQRINFP